MNASGTTVFVRKGAAWSEVTTLEAGSFRVRLGGLFRTTWMASLCSGLAGHRISIEQAHAKRTHNGSWIVELNVLALPGALDPSVVRYIEMAEADDPREPSPLLFESYQLTESADYGGTLMLMLEAKDSLGLLGCLLATLLSVGLFPLEMHIETRAGRAQDCLWLGAIGGGVPSAETKDTLAALLLAATSHA